MLTKQRAHDQVQAMLLRNCEALEVALGADQPLSGQHTSEDATRAVQASHVASRTVVASTKRGAQPDCLSVGYSLSVGHWPLAANPKDPYPARQNTSSTPSTMLSDCAL